MKTINIERFDYNNVEHREAVSNLINIYISDEMGGGVILDNNQKKMLAENLHNHPTAIVLLAKEPHEYCGLLVAFENYSTFTVSPMINIHDVIVNPNFRGLGVGRKLMQAISEIGKERDCNRITLEVRKDNIVAQQLYKSEGFDDTEPSMYYWRKYLSLIH